MTALEYSFLLHDIQTKIGPNFTELLNILHEAGKIDAKQKSEVEEFLKSTQI